MCDCSSISDSGTSIIPRATTIADTTPPAVIVEPSRRASDNLCLEEPDSDAISAAHDGSTIDCDAHQIAIERASAKTATEQVFCSPDDRMAPTVLGLLHSKTPNGTIRTSGRKAPHRSLLLPAKGQGRIRIEPYRLNARSHAGKNDVDNQDRVEGCLIRTDEGTGRCRRPYDDGVTSLGPLSCDSSFGKRNGEPNPAPSKNTSKRAMSTRAALSIETTHAKRKDKLVTSNRNGAMNPIGTRKTRATHDETMQQSPHGSCKPSDRSKDGSCKPSDCSKDGSCKPSDCSKDGSCKPSDRSKDGSCKPSDRSKDGSCKPSDRSKDGSCKPSDRSKDGSCKPSDRSKDGSCKPSDVAKDQKPLVNHDDTPWSWPLLVPYLALWPQYELLCRDRHRAAHPTACCDQPGFVALCFSDVSGDMQLLSCGGKENEAIVKEQQGEDVKEREEKEKDTKEDKEEEEEEEEEEETFKEEERREEGEGVGNINRLHGKNKTGRRNRKTLRRRDAGQQDLSSNYDARLRLWNPIDDDDDDDSTMNDTDENWMLSETQRTAHSCAGWLLAEKAIGLTNEPHVYGSV